MGLSPLADGPWIETDEDLPRYHRHKLQQREKLADRVYHASPDEAILRGLANGRCLKLVKSNIRDTVVWNPWQENAAKMADFGYTLSGHLLSLYLN